MNSQTKKHTSTLPHYHIKKCVEYLYMSKNHPIWRFLFAHIVIFLYLCTRKVLKMQ